MEPRAWDNMAIDPDAVWCEQCQGFVVITSKCQLTKEDHDDGAPCRYPCPQCDTLLNGGPCVREIRFAVSAYVPAESLENVPLDLMAVIGEINSTFAQAEQVLWKRLPADYRNSSPRIRKDIEALEGILKKHPAAISSSWVAELRKAFDNVVEQRDTLAHGEWSTGVQFEIRVPEPEPGTGRPSRAVPPRIRKQTGDTSEIEATQANLKSILSLTRHLLAVAQSPFAIPGHGRAESDLTE